MGVIIQWNSAQEADGASATGVGVAEAVPAMPVFLTDHINLTEGLQLPLCG